MIFKTKQPLSIAIALILLTLGVWLIILSLNPELQIHLLNKLTPDKNAASIDVLVLNRLHIALIGLGGLFVIGGILCLLYKNLIIFVLNKLKSGLLNGKQLLILLFKTIQNESLQHKLFLLTIIIAGVALRIKYLFQPCLYDEAFTYVNYASHNPLMIISYYTYPNNHILNSILTHISTHLFDLHLWSLRLPVFIAGIMLILVGYFTSRVIFNKTTGLFTAILLAATNEMVLYSTYARGYIFVCLFFILSLGLIFYSVKNKTKPNWVLLIALTAFGFLTVPTYLYCFIVLLLAIVLNYKTLQIKIKSITLFASLSIFGAVACYIPAMIVTGPESIIANDYIKFSFTFSYWLNVLCKVYYSLFIEGWAEHTTVPILIVIYFMLVIGIIKSFKSHKGLFILSLLALSLTFLIQKVVPPDRTLIFLLPFLFIYSAYGLNFLLKFNQMFSTIVGLALLSILTVKIYTTDLVIYNETIDNDKIVGYLKQQLKPNNKVVANFPVDYPLEVYMCIQQMDPELLRKTSNYDGTIFVIVNTFKKQSFNELMQKEGITQELETPTIAFELPNTIVYTTRLKTSN